MALVLALDPVLAALPFLPAGKGALILILGGLAMLAFSVLLGRFSRGGPYAFSDAGSPPVRRQVAPVAAPRRPKAARPNKAVRRQGWLDRTRMMASVPAAKPAALAFEPRRWDDAPARSDEEKAPAGGNTGTAWIAGLSPAVATMGLGQGQVLQANGERCVFFLAGCHSCRTRRPGARGCEATRRSIELVVREAAPNAQVTETACGAETHGGCGFEISRTR